MSLYEEVAKKRKVAVNVRKVIHLRKDIADDLQYVMDNGISYDEIVELALEKLPIRKLAEDIKKQQQ